LGILDSGKPLVIDHEEEAIFSVDKLGNRKRPSQHESIVVVFVWKHRRFRFRPEVVVAACIRVVVAHKIEQAAVIVIGPALGDHVDLRRVVAVFGGIDACLNLHLLNGVNAGLHHVAVEVRVGVVDAIQRVVVEHAAGWRSGANGHGDCVG
jgi:hypothetical protein